MRIRVDTDAKGRHDLGMTTNESTMRAQDRTRLTAAMRGEIWSDDEIAFLTDDANADTRDEDIAYALERTLYAVSTMRYTLKHGGREAIERTRGAHASVARVATCDRCHLVTPCFCDA